MLGGVTANKAFSVRRKRCGARPARGAAGTGSVRGVCSANTACSPQFVAYRV